MKKEKKKDKSDSEQKQESKSKLKQKINSRKRTNGSMAPKAGIGNHNRWANGGRLQKKKSV